MNERPAPGPKKGRGSASSKALRRIVPPLLLVDAHVRLSAYSTHLDDLEHMTRERVVEDSQERRRWRQRARVPLRGRPKTQKSDAGTT